MAEWDASYVNDLPDSAFLLILPGGRKDADGKTIPRNLRYFPVRNAAGDIDEPHVANALARIPQASTLTASQRAAAMDKAKSLAKQTNVSGGKGEYTGSAGSGRSKAPGEILTRTFEMVLEVRDGAGDGRTLVGRAVPYGQTATIAGGRERFMPGAFARQIAGGADQLQRVKLYDSHSARLSGQQPIGRTASLTERPDGAWGEWSLYQTTRANDALELVRTGEVVGLSVGFKALDGGTKRGTDGAYERYGAHMDHVVLTHEPAYSGAQVTAVRSAHPAAGYSRDLERARLILDRTRAG